MHESGSPLDLRSSNRRAAVSPEFQGIQGPRSRLVIAVLRYIVTAGQKTLFQSRDAIILSSLEILRRRNTKAYHAVLACPSRSVLVVF
jgi:hypothetical protein